MVFRPMLRARSTDLRERERDLLRDLDRDLPRLFLERDRERERERDLERERVLDLKKTKNKKLIILTNIYLN
jgi:hypothetical protein